MPPSDPDPAGELGSTSSSLWAPNGTTISSELACRVKWRGQPFCGQLHSFSCRWRVHLCVRKISHKAEFLTVLTVSSNVFIYTLEYLVT